MADVPDLDAIGSANSTPAGSVPDWDAIDSANSTPAGSVPDWGALDSSVSSSDTGDALPLTIHAKERRDQMAPYLAEASKNEAEQFSEFGFAANALASLNAVDPGGKIPLLSPALDAAVKAGYAALGAGTGATWQERYSDLGRKLEAEQAVSEARHPIANTVGSVLAGALLPTFGAARLGPAIQRGIASTIGPGIISAAGGVGGDIAGAGLLSAGYGAASGAETGDTLEERAQNAIRSAKAGALAGPSVMGYNIPLAVALPLAGKAIEAGARMPMMTGDPAASKLKNALQADTAARAELGPINPTSPALGMTAADVGAADKANQPWMIGDVGGENTRNLARQVANVSPTAKTILQSPLEGRFQSQGGRFSDFAKGLFSASAPEVRDQLQSAAKVQNKGAYDAAYNHPNAQAMWGPEFQQMTASPAVQDAIGKAETIGKNYAAATGTPPVVNPFVKGEDGVWSLKKNPDGSVAIPNLQFWDQVKQALDDQVQSLYASGSNAANSVKNVRNRLRDTLDEQVPNYADARSGAAKFFKADDMLEAGSNFTKRMNVFDYADAQKALAAATPAERELFGTGMASAIAHEAANSKDTSNVVRLFNSPQLREKMELGMGAARAASVESYLRRESMMNMLRTAVGGNSSTAAQLMALGMAGGEGVKALWDNKEDLLENPGKAAAAGAAAIAASALIKYNHNMDRTLAPQIARLLTSSDPADIRRIHAASVQSYKIRDAIRNAEMGIAANFARMKEKSNPSSPFVPQPEPPLYGREGRTERASGGRIMDHDAEADRLVRAADMAKNSVNKTTEKLLDVPDAAIIKALDVAQQAI